MKETRVTLPELGLVAGTRAILGLGLGLLLADRFATGPRRAVGWTLVLIGAASTVPLALEIFGGRRLTTGVATPESVMNGPRCDNRFNLEREFARS